MYLLFVILMVIAALLMCFIVLIQNSKGGGLASGFSSSNAIMGVRKTTDFLEKATWGLAISFLILLLLKMQCWNRLRKNNRLTRITCLLVLLHRKQMLLLRQSLHLQQKLRHRLKLRLLLLNNPFGLQRGIG